MPTILRSILGATVEGGPYEGWPFCAAVAIREGRLTPTEARRELVAEARRHRDDEVAAADRAVDHYLALPDPAEVGVAEPSPPSLSEPRP